MLEQIQESAAFLRSELKTLPKIAIILGSGLGELVNHIQIDKEIKYEDIPHFPLSTVEGHSGKLIFGSLGGKQIMAMQGRFHYYEGYDMKAVTFPVRVMKAIGVEFLFVSNAAGGMNPSFRVGDLMFINDHINLFPEHPLRGKNHKELGVRFLDMHQAYSMELLTVARNAAKAMNIEVKEGVYLGTSGPTFETPSEYRMFYRMGADAVGMSTVPEVIVANHGGMQVFAVSIITDMWFDNNPIEVSHEEVLEAANGAQPKMTAIMTEIIKQLNV